MAKAKALPVPMVLDTRDEWFEAFDNAIAAMVERGRIFSADDLREIMPEPGHPNWWGAGFRRAIGAGLITQAGFDLSRTKSRNGGVVRTWAPRNAITEGTTNDR